MDNLSQNAPQSADPPRFALLRHIVTEPPSEGTIGPRSSHWDLMLEDRFETMCEIVKMADSDPQNQRTLFTLALESLPRRDGEALIAVELQPHRKLYLDYEGVISGGRGEVLQLASGNLKTIERSTTHWHFQLDSPDLVAQLKIVRLAGESAPQLRGANYSWRVEVDRWWTGPASRIITSSRSATDQSPN